MGMFDDLVPDASASAGPSRLSFDDLIPADKPSAVVDVAKSAGAGYLKGVAGVVGLPAFLGGVVQSGVDWAQGKAQGVPFEEMQARNAARAVIPPSAIEAASPAGIVRGLESLGGPLHKPQTTAGEFAGTVAEFIPGAALGPGNAARNALVYGVAPGLASEGSGQAARVIAPEAETAARVVGGIGAAGGLAFATRPNVAGQAVARATEGVTPAQVDAMEALIADARARGVDLSRAEALAQVTNGGTRLPDLQRVVEGQGGLKEFYANRPAQVEAAGQQAFAQVAPQAPSPSGIGPAVGQAAGQTVGDVTDLINRTTRPLYQQAEPVRLGPQVQGALASDPLYAQTLQEIRNNPALNRTIANLPDDAVGVQDLVRRRMGENAENASVPGQATTSNLAAANYTDAAAPITAAADTATGSRPAFNGQPAQVGTYEAARDAQAQLRQQYLEPLMNGPIGKLAQRDLPTKRALEVLFPANPLPGSAGEVQDAVRAVAVRNPTAARQIVRTHAESVFNEATQALQSGPNQFGGATFAAVIRGNRQQAENLAAAISALPGGEQILPGFDRFLDIMQATGQRQRVGSQTAFNTEALAELKRGGTIGTVSTLAAGAGTKIPAKALSRFEQWNQGRNVDQIARILVDPEAATLFRHLATSDPTSTKAAALVARLSAIGARSGDRQQTQRRP